MPRPRKRPRLWLRPAKRRAGKIIAQAVWTILDGGKHIATGCLASQAEDADKALQAYIADKYEPARRRQAIEAIPVADVLSLYLDAVTDTVSDLNKLTQRVGRLLDFWGDRTLADVNGATCRQYARERGSVSGARRELEDLRAAITRHRKDGLHREILEVALPERGASRDRWLTRSEAATLLWTCWRYRERQTAHRGPQKGQVIETDKRPLRHLARFILIGLYTGTRAGAIASASPTPGDGRSFVDLDRGVFYRLAQGRKATNKRQPPAPIPPRLLAHMRRWARLGIARSHFVEFNGQPVKSVKTAFASAVRLSGIEHASPHTLRHTAATWLMLNGAPTWQAAGFLGMSEKTLRDVYGHHHPDFQNEAVEAITRKRPRVSLVLSLAEERKRRAGNG